MFEHIDFYSIGSFMLLIIIGFVAYKFLAQLFARHSFSKEENSVSNNLDSIKSSDPSEETAPTEDQVELNQFRPAQQHQVQQVGTSPPSSPPCGPTKRTEIILNCLTLPPQKPLETITNSHYVRLPPRVAVRAAATSASLMSIEPLFFPDARLPCDLYCDALIGGQSRCACNRKARRFGRRVHLGQKRKTSLTTVLRCLAQTENNIDLCIFLFTLKKTAKLLIDLHKMGRKIRVISDADRVKCVNDQIPALKRAGIEVRERPQRKAARNEPKMHNKFVIIDGRTLIMGSFNWTVSAVTANHESLVKIIDSASVGKFREEFNKIWDSYRPKGAPAEVRINMPF